MQTAAEKRREEIPSWSGWKAAAAAEEQQAERGRKQQGAHS